jgi:hypothetical protein
MGLLRLAEVAWHHRTVARSAQVTRWHRVAMSLPFPRKPPCIHLTASPPGSRVRTKDFLPCVYIYIHIQETRFNLAQNLYHVRFLSAWAGRRRPTSGVIQGPIRKASAPRGCTIHACRLTVEEARISRTPHASGPLARAMTRVNREPTAIGPIDVLALMIERICIGHRTQRTTQKGWADAHIQAVLPRCCWSQAKPRALLLSIEKCVFPLSSISMTSPALGSGQTPPR